MTEKVKKVSLEFVENGPILVKINDRIDAALCRCGYSTNKPFCDGSHSAYGFEAEHKELVIYEEK